jgi:DNA-binding response OmpR family regulator
MPAGTLLIVDDDSEITALLREFFEEGGFQVVTAGTGADAERWLRDPGATLPDLVLLDLICPILSCSI